MAEERARDMEWEPHGGLWGDRIDGQRGDRRPRGDVGVALRARRRSGRTSPEELIAAAHAACFCMALSHGLAEAGNPPEKLDVTATRTFVPGTGITQMKLDVTGTVRGSTRRRSSRRPRARATTARSRGALKGNVEILLDARLAS